ncbi:phosphatidylserine decarboxylase related protein [Methanosalsum zhilinae DSM 4017]|uniref:Putative archaetidylserine decarboxylase proenzyme n=1 Tax=Methanosalsum zhilinae (strain DSM 4017 / NBRC 107636 / OCM 62 / WeN5) TaxID=679901 RepID=F7XPZ1_METZD|nr:phosphatidylserine decarboxylase [Methanosalsum zhilinae]AEH61517.1 phosphatidylserine decarboxylase related protein [Methanosalsum zhilinae DSM 4017]
MVARGSFSWIAAAVTITAAVAIIAYTTQMSAAKYATASSLSATAFFLWFFRDPKRRTRICNNCLIAPADGRIIDIRNRKICIFMNIHNVHVNRVPISGRVVNIEYKKGGYLPAFCKDSERNERCEITLETPHGEITVTQIAGTLVRRIVSYVQIDDKVIQGQKIGMIKFGSRVDVTVPESLTITCKKGDRVIAGETVIAKMQGVNRGN